MNKTSLITLIVAVMVGLGAMKLSQAMLAPTKKSGEEMQEVLAAARDFKADEVLKPDMVKVIQMGKSTVPPNSFKSFKEVEERWVRTAMMEDDVLVEKKLGPKGTPPGLVANIPKGMRAVAIDVTEQSGVSGFILPGHHVDVVRYESSDKNETRGETILQNVLVLAAGVLFTRPEERAVQSRTVTLALLPGDVDILVAARGKGSLSLALRGVNDHDVVARPKPKPAIDPEREKLLKLEGAKRQKLERELQELKQQLARKPAEPPAPKPRPAPRIAAIYRGVHNLQRVRLDSAGVSELEPLDRDELDGAARDRSQRGFRPNTAQASGDALEP
jgi:pilus assembly protein CpaB